MADDKILTKQQLDTVTQNHHVKYFSNEDL